MKKNKAFNIQLNITFTNLMGAFGYIFCVVKSDQYETGIWAGVALLLGRASVEGYKHVNGKKNVK